MTENRFTLKKFLSNEYGLLDDEKEIAYVSHKSAFTICDLLNCLNDEKEQLQEENTELKNDNKRMVKFIMSKGFSLKDYLEWLNEEVWK